MNTESEAFQGTSISSNTDTNTRKKGEPRKTHQTLSGDAISLRDSEKNTQATRSILLRQT
jgi:hypothetical protein